MQDELKKLIEKLRSELAGIDGDDESKARLEKIIKEVEKRALVDTDEDDGPMENLGEFIDENVTHFETSHPAITETINNIANVLSNLGI